MQTLLEYIKKSSASTYLRLPKIDASVTYPELLKDLEGTDIKLINLDYIIFDTEREMKLLNYCSETKLPVAGYFTADTSTLWIGIVVPISSETYPIAEFGFLFSKDGRLMFIRYKQIKPNLKEGGGFSSNQTSREKILNKYRDVCKQMKTLA